MSVTYTAVLPVRRETVLFVSALLHVERARRGLVEIVGIIDKGPSVASAQASW